MVAWLKKATARDDERLGHVYSDSEQLWATDGYVLHALDVATGQWPDNPKRGRRAPGGERGQHPSRRQRAPAREPMASIVISAEALRDAAEGQEGFVRLSIYDEPRALELSSGGKYALVMAVNGVQEWWFGGRRRDSMHGAAARGSGCLYRCIALSLPPGHVTCPNTA